MSKRDGKTITDPKDPRPGLKSERLARAGKVATRLVPPVHALLEDVNMLAKAELAKLRAKQAASEDPTPGLPKALDLLTSAINRGYDLDVKVQEEMDGQLGDLSDEELAELARKRLGDGNG